MKNTIFIGKIIRSICGGLVAAGLCSCGGATLYDLQCEYLTTDAVIDVPTPRLSWKIRSQERGFRQTAYRIIVSESESEVANGKGTVWDSGLVQSDNTLNIPYAGSALASNRTYFWRAFTIDASQKETGSSPARFHTGLLKASDWKAKWITTTEDIGLQSPVYHKEFNVGTALKEAWVYAVGVGVYELWLNGQKVGDRVLSPAISDFHQTALYAAYNVTGLLHKGVNALGAMTGNGAYNMHKLPHRYGWNEERRMGNPCFLMQLHLRYADGTEETVLTDETWKYTWGPVTYNDIYGGEDYDARKEIDGWASPGLDVAAWKPVAIDKGPKGKLRYDNTPIRVTQVLTPVAHTKLRKGVYLFDLGQNIAGWWRIDVKGHAGQTVRIRGDETLNRQLFPKPLETGDSLSFTAPYHSLVWSDYTLRTDSREHYEPRFFYSGFRYIEVATSDGDDLAEVSVKGCVVRSDLPDNGTWASSNGLLNKIRAAGRWSLMSNLVGYPTDCPHREKGAYTGDGQVIAETSMHEFNMAPFYMKWLDDMRDAQEPNGRIPNTTPPIVGGMGGGVAWGSAYILLPWWMYQYYDDPIMMHEHYPNMKRYIEYLRQLARSDRKPEQPYIINFFQGYWYSLGEWCAPKPFDNPAMPNDCPNHDVVNTFYYYYDTSLMAEIAHLLGKDDDAVRYRVLSDSIKAAFCETFVNPETALVGLDTPYQTYLLVALKGNLIPDSLRNAVTKNIIDDIRQRNNHLNTGIVGTKYLWPFLVENDYGDLAYTVATQTSYPGYGYWIENGLTALPEQWDGIQSQNHQMFGSITEYFYKYLAGIRSPVEGITTRGYRHIHIAPELPDSLNSVSATLETVSGEVASSWTRTATGVHYSITVPANTSATITIAASDTAAIAESGTPLWETGTFIAGVKGITSVTASEGHLNIEAGAGSYEFELRE
ncbi:MAG: glycoside hydrolase family 78 protein [Bacteroidales bacterium]|jgi:alpha-L-rhamnosidase|nr:glycoside hydrolase family 78 protein [Bacteroidales bacterium]